MTTLENWILQACNAFGLQADFGFVVDIDSDHQLQVVARINNIGARNGMLVVRNYDEIRPYAEYLIQAEYSYSVLDEPQPDEVFDLDSFKEMFQDWGMLG